MECTSIFTKINTDVNHFDLNITIFLDRWETGYLHRYSTQTAAFSLTHSKLQLNIWKIRQMLTIKLRSLEVHVSQIISQTQAHDYCSMRREQRTNSCQPCDNIQSSAPQYYHQFQEQKRQFRSRHRLGVVAQDSSVHCNCRSPVIQTVGVRHGGDGLC